MGTYPKVSKMKEDHKMQNSWEAMSKARTAKYQAYKKTVMPIIKEIQASGVKSLQGIADALSDRKIKTRYGKDIWHLRILFSLLLV